MRKNKYFHLLCMTIMVSAIFSCAETKDEKETVEEVEITENEQNRFDSFLGLSYGDEEHELASILGPMTGGAYTVDSTMFIYTFQRVDRILIEVWVNAITGKITTVFMEDLSLENNFNADLEKAAEEYKISDKDKNWFGKSLEEIKEIMGTPDEESAIDGKQLLTYDSEDLLRTVTFKFYKEQGGICSSVLVNWFFK